MLSTDCLCNANEFGCFQLRSQNVHIQLLCTGLPTFICNFCSSNREGTNGLERNGRHKAHLKYRNTKEFSKNKPETNDLPIDVNSIVTPSQLTCDGSNQLTKICLENRHSSNDHWTLRATTLSWIHYYLFYTFEEQRSEHVLR